MEHRPDRRLPVRADRRRPAADLQHLGDRRRQPPNGTDRKLSDRIPCYALYADPPLGRVGLSAGQARATGRRIKVGRRLSSRVGRALEKDEQTSFMEIVFDADSDAILGETVLGTAVMRQSTRC